MTLGSLASSRELSGLPMPCSLASISFSPSKSTSRLRALGCLIPHKSEGAQGENEIEASEQGMGKPDNSRLLASEPSVIRRRALLYRARRRIRTSRQS
jgi:hypothetical protein